MDNGKDVKLIEYDPWKKIEEYRSFKRRTQSYETGFSREERFLMNKIRSDLLQKMYNGKSVKLNRKGKKRKAMETGEI